MTRVLPACGIVLAGLFAAASAQAATTCNVSTTGANFGSYDPTNGVSGSAIGSVSLNCTYTGTGFTAALTIATGNSGSYSNRTMKLGTQSLNYNLYIDAGHTEVFGNGTGGSYYYDGCFFGGTYQCPSGGGVSGSTLSGAVYGLLPGGQDVGAGTYTDTLVVTVTY